MEVDQYKPGGIERGVLGRLIDIIASAAAAAPIASVSGNAICRLCFRVFALSFCTLSTLVRWCPSSSAAIVTQLVTRLRARDQTDPLLVRHCQSVGYRRSPGNLDSRVTRSIGECRMSLWSTVVVKPSRSAGRLPCFGGFFRSWPSEPSELARPSGQDRIDRCL